MKKCPYCAEEIQDEAVKCRYCGSDLREGVGIVLDSIALTDKGGTLKFSNGSVDSVASALEKFFNSNGFSLEEGERTRGVYGLGSAGARGFAGGFVKRRKYRFAITHEGTNVTASVESAMSGWSGSAVGAIREKQARKEFNAKMQAHFSDYR